MEWSLRDYGIEPTIWDGDPNCKHQFTKESYRNPMNRGEGHDQYHKEKGYKTELFKLNDIKHGFCQKCGAWRGVLGLEPNFELYISHLCSIYDIVYRKLKKTGTLFVNLGDTFSAGGRSGSKKYFENGHKQFGKNDPKGRYQAPKKVEGFKSKCLLGIPQRFVLEMVNRGWIWRNTLIWHKPNAMPSSAKDRFSVDFEYVYFFVKSSKNQYWVNENTAQLVSKQPKGIRGIEGIDWEWRECKKCLGTGVKHDKCKYCKGNGYYYDKSLRPVKCKKCSGLGRIRRVKICKSCKGERVKKYNFWRGRNYYFEQQREQLSQKKSTQNRYKYAPATDANVKCNGSQMGVNPTNAYNKYFPSNLHSNKKTLMSYTEQDLQTIHRRRDTIKKLQSDIRLGREKTTSKYYGEGLDASKRLNQPQQLAKYERHGRNKRCVWSIPTKPNPEAHFATFPPDLVKPMIKAGCPEFVCSECGMPRELIIKEKGYTDCGCNASYKPGIVTDHFCGTGTTLKTAFGLGRDFIGIEISEEYVEKIAKKLLNSTKNRRLTEFV